MIAHINININNMLIIYKHILKCSRGTWLALLVEHRTLDLEVVGSCPTWGVEIT